MVTVDQYHFEILNILFKPKVKKTLPKSAKTADARLNDILWRDIYAVVTNSRFANTAV